MMVVGSLARPLVEKRRSLNSDARPTTERISKKVAPPISTIASEKLSEAEVIQRARDGRQATEPPRHREKVHNTNDWESEMRYCAETMRAMASSNVTLFSR
jgi:hypothetical protein